MERLLKHSEAAQRDQAAAIARAETEQKAKAEALARAEAEQKEKARAQRRAGRLTWAAALLGLILFGSAIWQSVETEKREINVMMSLAHEAYLAGQYDKAMRTRRSPVGCANVRERPAFRNLAGYYVRPAHVPDNESRSRPPPANANVIGSERLGFPHVR